MRIEKKSIYDLNPASYNPRQDIEPIIWNERTGNVVGGHQRLKVLRQLGETEIDCVIVDYPEAQEKALNVALNKISNDWDNEKLTELLRDLQETDIDLTLTGFNSAELDKVLNEEIFEEVPVDKWQESREKGYKNVSVDKTYNMYRLYEYDVNRTSGYYQLPTLKACHYVPEELIGYDELPLKKKPPEGMGVHFFMHDYQFSAMWTRPYECIEKFRDFSCVLLPDFSTYWDMPMAMKIWNLYRMRLIGQIMQDEGLEVLPIVRGLGDETLNWCFEGIEPGGVIVYSTQGIMKGNETFKDICRRELSGAIKALKPECIVLYGADIGLDFEGIPVKQIKARRL